MSENWLGFAVFRSVLPTASCKTFASLATLTVTVCPASVAIVSVPPAMVFTVPSSEALVAGDCRSRRRGCLGLGRGCKACRSRQGKKNSEAERNSE